MRQKRCRKPRIEAVAVVLSMLVLFGGACGPGPGQHDPRLRDQLHAILHRLDHAGAVVTARVVELPSRRELCAENIRMPFMPASNMKLITSAAGLNTFGPDHTFNTYLAYDGENLWLLGTGDPAAGDAPVARRSGNSTTTVLDQWAQALLDRGITRVPGKLLYFDGALDAYGLHPSWEHDDLVHWYATPVSGLNFNDNCVDVTVTPRQKGEPAGYEVVPAVRNLVVINQCVSGCDARPSIARMAYADVIVLGGGCNERKSLKSKPVTDPGAFFADALLTHLQQRGITVAGPIEQAPLPLDGQMPPRPDRIVAVHRSHMRDIMWRVNQSSQNLFAECLWNLTGQAHDSRQGLNRPGSWESGERAVREFLRESGVDGRSLVAADGSGLSRANRVTSRMLTDVLAVMFDHEHGGVFRASLAQPGEAGTLHRRLQDLTGHVFAKTGYIRGVRALSGYIHTHSGRWLCFSIIYNNVPSSVKPFEQLQDEACRLLVEWPDLPERPGGQAAPVVVAASYGAAEPLPGAPRLLALPAQRASVSGTSSTPYCSQPGASKCHHSVSSP